MKNNPSKTSHQPHREPREMIDLNLIPPRHKRRKFNPLVILAFLLLIVITGLLYPAGRTYFQAQQEYSDIKTQFDQLQTEMDNYPSVAERKENLLGKIENKNQQLQDIQSKYDEIQLNYTVWSSLLFGVLDAVPVETAVQSIQQNGTRVVISGGSASYDQVLILRDNLRGLSTFQVVQIDSIQRLDEQTPTGSSQGFPFQFTITLNTQQEVTQP